MRSHVEHDVSFTRCDFPSFLQQRSPHQRSHQQRPRQRYPTTTPSPYGVKQPPPPQKRPQTRPTSEYSAHPNHPQTTTAQDAKWTNACQRHQPPTIKTHKRRRASAKPDNDPTTTTLDRQWPPLPSSYELCSPPPATNGKPPSDYRTTARNPSKPTGDEEHPPQPPTNVDGRPQTQTTTTTLDRKRPLPLASDECRPPAMTRTNGRRC